MAKNEINSIREKYWSEHFCEENKSTSKVAGEGGNAQVLIVTLKDTENIQVAYKELGKFSPEKKLRFKDEIETMVKLKSVEGVMPILDYSIDGLFYTMPIATTLKDYFKPKLEEAIKSAGEYEKYRTEIAGVEHKFVGYVKEVVYCILDVISILSTIHKLGFSHRDIKPDNLFFLDNHFVLGDFGLVDFPDKTNNTTVTQNIGAKFTIAPEMKRNPDTADGKIADVYSLGKTFWMLLTGNDIYSFEGQYNFLDKEHDLSKFIHLKYVHLPEIHEVIKLATTNDPESRISLSEFKQILEKWLKVIDDYHLQSISKWNFINDFLFKDTSPKTTIWNRLDDIIHILNFLGRFSNSFNCAGPAGWIDFDYVCKANEKGCLYFRQHHNSESYTIIKPKQLVFEYLENNSSWNYFLLESEKTDFIHHNSEYKVEELVEDYPAHYVYVQYPIYGVYDYDKGNQFPEGYIIVQRYFDGNFLFYLKQHTRDRIFDDRMLKANQNPYYRFRECVEKRINGEDISEYFITSESERDENMIVSPKNDIYIENFSDGESEMSFPQRITIPIVEQKTKNSRILYHFCTSKGLKGFDKLFKKQFLLKDGSFIQKNQEVSDDLLFAVYNKEDAEKTLICIQEQINYKVDVVLKRICKPSHLFTEEEMLQEMISVDDRNSYVWVIDEDGFAKLIPNSPNRDLYPVYSHALPSCSRYFGKYMLTSKREIHQNYVDMLLTWYEHLKNNKQMDDHNVDASEYWFDNEKLKELIIFIHQLMVDN